MSFLRNSIFGVVMSFQCIPVSIGLILFKTFGVTMYFLSHSCIYRSCHLWYFRRSDFLSFRCCTYRCSPIHSTSLARSFLTRSNRMYGTTIGVVIFDIFCVAVFFHCIPVSKGLVIFDIFSGAMSFLRRSSHQILRSIAAV